MCIIYIERSVYDAYFINGGTVGIAFLVEKSMLSITKGIKKSNR